MKHTRHRSFRFQWLFTLALLCGGVSEAVFAEDQLKLSGVFADHMLLQRDKPVPVWGWTNPGEQVTVEFSDQTKSATADDTGKWLVKLDPMSARTQPGSLVVKSPAGDQELRVTDILIGDVFMLAGQSNMSWWLSGSTDGEDAVKRANYPWLRHFSPGWQLADEPAADVSKGARWQTCTPETAGRFSGVGFFFAEALHAAHDVPIALIQTDVAGTWGENWISRAAMDADPEFRYSLDKYEQALAKLPEEQQRWETEKAEHAKKVAEAKASGKNPPTASYFVKNGPMGPQHSRRPSALYNGRVAPLMPFAMRGIVWYQGEGNTAVKLAEHYHKLLTTLVQSWREGFEQGNLPFLIVQLPRYDYDDPWHSWPLIREAQLRVAQGQPNCGLVTLMDEGERNDVHPKNKRPVGERLARLARAMIHDADLVQTGPLLDRHEIANGAVRLHFRHAGEGLRCSDDALRSFTVCGDDKVFHPAQAEITGKDSIRVTSTAVSDPVAVRYAWEPFPDCNLFNSVGLPASPLRTDQFEVGHYLPLEPYLKRRKRKGTAQPLGLRGGPNATVLKDGKPYRGIGINYFSCFLRTLKDGNDTSYDAGFATLAEKGIPFARFCATGFWPRDMKLYVEDREEYFRRLDGVVHSAQKHGIGLIPSLFWHYACVPDLVGEPMDQWANPNSKTQAWMRNYVREVVTRYRDNPAIWAWELGNEFSLHANLPNAKDHRPKVHHSLGTPDTRSERDDLTYEMVGTAFAAFATAVREHDPHRLIFTGDSFPRLSAWHQERENSWTHDTMQQFAEMLAKANPDPISGISLHAYEDDDQRFDEAMAVACKLNKPIFIGEFGAQHETPEQAAKCRRLLKAIIDHKIPLAALWVFDHPHQKDFNVTADNGRAWQLDLIAEANRKLRTQAALSEKVLEKATIKSLADRVHNYQTSQGTRFNNQHWVRGTYYAGLMAMYESTSDRAYLDDCMEWGKQVSWRIKEQGGGPYESGAYPLICGQIWYGCYRAENDEMMMRPTLAFLEDPKVENPLSAPGEWYLENTGHRFVDGLFTAPPALAMLYQMTGDEKYVNWMDACFWDVHGEIFDHDAGLFYRDARSIPRKTKNGKKVLWSRGNGWAFGGLTRILKHLPKHHASYARYKALYVQMAESLAMRQQDDGFWRPNLDDSEQYNVWESSGTGFFTYGIAWGINNGILDRDRFLPVAKNGWAALASVVNEEGRVGWSQPPGGGPGNVEETDSTSYGAGIFLLAASEVYLLTQ